MTIGAQAPFGRVLADDGAVFVEPAHSGSSDCPASGSTASVTVPPDNSIRVGSTSTSETGVDTATCAETGRCVHDQRDARGPLEEIHFVPEPTLAQHVAMISEQDDDGIVRQSE